MRALNMPEWRTTKTWMADCRAARKRRARSSMKPEPAWSPPSGAVPWGSPLFAR